MQCNSQFWPAFKNPEFRGFLKQLRGRVLAKSIYFLRSHQLIVESARFLFIMKGEEVDEQPLGHILKQKQNELNFFKILKNATQESHDVTEELQIFQFSL